MPPPPRPALRVMHQAPPVTWPGSVQTKLESARGSRNAILPPATQYGPGMVQRQAQAGIAPSRALHGAPVIHWPLNAQMIVQAKAAPLGSPHLQPPPILTRAAVLQRARVRHRRFDAELQQQFANAFLAHAALVAPVTPDNPQAADLVAQQIRPANDLDCAAIEGTAAGAGAAAPFVYATNSNAPAPGTVQATLGLLAAPTRTGGNTAVHAELKIYENNAAVAYIGISKRCCLLCELALNTVGAPGHRGCHGELYDKWTFPNFILNANLPAFLGAAANGIYVTLSQISQREALSLIENNLKQYKD
ncbi:MAG TPA: nucleic acid/nucleotide deaminase domain-containing protein [Aliidongia sp.]|nr:nucleic acid/nucleotide deaminase domain-containing protein [Aliidongia sp.]